MNRNSKSRVILPIAATAAAIFALAGCAGTSTANGGSGSKDGPYNVTMILGVSGDEGYLTDVCGAKSIAKNNKVKLNVQAPAQFDPDLQVPVLQAAIAKHPDAIIIAPTDSKALIAPIQQAVQAGIKVILFDTTLDDLSGISTVVGVDNAAGGELGAQTLAKLIGDKGSVFVNNVNPGISTTDARQAGFEKEIKKISGVDYLGPQYNSNDPQKAASLTSSTLTAHPDLAGVFGTNLFSVEGTVTGLRNAGKLGQVKVVGFDAGPSQVDSLKTGDVQALIAQNLHEMGATAMKKTVDILQGKTVKKQYSVGFTAITKSDLGTPKGDKAIYKAKCN